MDEIKRSRIKRKGKEVYVNQNSQRGAEKERLDTGETDCKPSRN